ncbi:MBL fold metallo-hydrolase [Falsibacillus albus]|uniref:MBL fold metallo-hydrolase n=1 Tax=Falsibacillus albus TaxID=2478915 RepID=A0A3L7JVZ1_9BACI|nr:MBL fold metallo-hydrolase [Falsibacillus albus]RLQ94475.1 MBL fold metallo-hydrolase [Falsibacillus albus]
MKTFYSEHFKLKEIADGIFAAIDSGRGALGNAGIIDMGGFTVVVDTMMTLQAAADLKSAAQALIGKPIKYVATTHCHGDHVRGNQLFDEAAIISTPSTYEAMKERIMPQVKMQIENESAYLSMLTGQLETEKNEEKRSELRSSITLVEEIAKTIHDFSLRLPDVTFEDKLTIAGSTRTLELLHFGSAHSISDTVVWLPDDKVVFAGDLLFVESFPSFQEGNYRRWNRVLDELNKLPFTCAVPGHGGVGGKEDIQHLKELIEHMIQAGDAISAESAAEQLLIPDKFAKWSAQSLFFRNVKKVFNDRQPDK